jgi:hypothetical protein
VSITESRKTTPKILKVHTSCAFVMWYDHSLVPTLLKKNLTLHDEPVLSTSDPLKDHPDYLRKVSSKNSIRISCLYYQCYITCFFPLSHPLLIHQKQCLILLASKIFDIWTCHKKVYYSFSSFPCLKCDITSVLLKVQVVDEHLPTFRKVVMSS